MLLAAGSKQQQPGARPTRGRASFRMAKF